MKVLLFSVYDKITGTFGEVFAAPNVGTAVRRFNYVLKNASECAGDCDLYKLASYDWNQGTIKGLDKPEYICHFGDDWSCEQ